MSPAEIDQRPTHDLADAPNAEIGEPPVILVYTAIMARRPDLVEPLAMAVEAGRSLETGEEKTPKHRSEIPQINFRRTLAAQRQTIRTQHISDMNRREALEFDSKFQGRGPTDPSGRNIVPAPGSLGDRPTPPGRTSATTCIRPWARPPAAACVPRREVVEPALAFADRTLRGRLADEERNAVAMVIKSPKLGQEIAGCIGLADAKTAVRLPLETLVGKHRIEIEADDRQIDRMFLQPIEIALVRTISQQP